MCIILCYKKLEIYEYTCYCCRSRGCVIYFIRLCGFDIELCGFFLFSRSIGVWRNHRVKKTVEIISSFTRTHESRYSLLKRLWNAGFDSAARESHGFVYLYIPYDIRDFRSDALLANSYSRLEEQAFIKDLKKKQAHIHCEDSLHLTFGWP